MLAISGSALSWEQMHGVLSSIARDGSDLTVVHLKRDVESNDRGATLDELVHVWRNISVLRSSLHEHSHLIQESGFAMLVEMTGLSCGKCSESLLLEYSHVSPHKGIRKESGSLSQFVHFSEFLLILINCPCKIAFKQQKNPRFINLKRIKFFNLLHSN